MSFADIAGQYLSNRWDQATQPFTDPEGYFNNRLQQEFGVDMNGNTKPISTTIKYGEDGTHEVTTKHQITPVAPTSNENLQGAMSLDTTPTVQPLPQPGPPVQVAANNQQLPQTQPWGQYPLPQAASVPQAAVPQTQAQIPVAPDQSSAEVQRLQQQNIQAQGTPVGAVAPEAKTVVTPNGSIAATTEPVNVQKPAVPTQAGTTNAPPSEAQIAQQMAQEQAQDQENGASQQNKIRHHDQLVAVANEKDPVAKRQQYATILADPTLTDENKKLVYKQIHDEHSQAERMKAALKEVDAMTPNDAARALKKKDEEGNFVKYFLAHRLGLTEMARDQAAKLGYGNTVTSEMGPDNQRYRVERDLNGQIRNAQDVNGNDVGQDVLAKLSASAYSMKGATPASSMYKDPEGNLWSHTAIPGTTKTVWTNQKTGVAQDTAPAGLTPAGQVNPVSKANIAILQNKIKKMEADNVEAARTGSSPIHSVEEIKALKEALQSGGGSVAATEPPAKPPAGGAKVEPTVAGQPTNAKAPANNNPGNIIDSQFARAHGATNTGPIGSQGRFANFPDVNAGESAQHTLLTNPTYSRLPLRDIPKVWAPKGDGKNDPAAYAQSLQKLTGFDDRTMGKSYLELTPDQQQTFRDAQRQIEHGAGISGGKLEKVSTGVWSTPEANAIAERNPTAASIARYESQPPSATGRNSAGAAALMNDVRRINPDYNDQKYKAAQVVRNDYAKVNPASAGGQLQAVNRAIPHLAQYEEAVKALNNGNMPLVNDIVNKFGYNVGNDKVAAAKAIQNLVSTEVQKAVAGGLGGVAERHDLASQLGTNLSDKQLARVIHEYQGLMVEQGRGLKQNWTANGLPAKEWDTKLVPKARAVFEQHDREEKNTRSKW